jgi:hypothetical protein
VYTKDLFSRYGLLDLAAAWAYFISATKGRSNLIPSSSSNGERRSLGRITASFGFLFHHVSGTFYSARDQRLLIDWPLGTIVIAGPKTLEFYEQLSNHRATLIRADGKNILSVKMHLNSEGLAEKDAEVVTPEIGSERLAALR